VVQPLLDDNGGLGLSVGTLSKLGEDDLLATEKIRGLYGLDMYDVGVVWTWTG